MSDEPADPPRDPTRDPESRPAERPRPGPSRGRTRIMRLARLAAFVYLGSLTVLYSLQTRLIFPGQETQGQPFAEVRPRPGTELVHLKTQRGDSIVALFGPALTPDGRPHPQAEDRPTLVYFYGNAMCLSYA